MCCNIGCELVFGSNSLNKHEAHAAVFCRFGFCVVTESEVAPCNVDIL